MKAIPMVYSCSGCLAAAQTANWVALWLDRSGEAEMGCTAGVGGGVQTLVFAAKSAGKVIAIDGCLLACSQACLRQVGREPDLHIQLAKLGPGKRTSDPFSTANAERALKHVRERMAEAGLLQGAA